MTCALFPLPSSLSPSQLTRPIPLWQPSVLSQAQSAVLNRAAGRAPPASTPPQAPASADYPPPRPPSTPREHLRGKLGHLVSAIADAQKSGSRESLDSATPQLEGWRATPTSSSMLSPSTPPHPAPAAACTCGRVLAATGCSRDSWSCESTRSHAHLPIS